MDNFTRIVEAADPRSVLDAPMEPGLVPLPTFWPTPWDDNFDRCECDGEDADCGNATQVFDELYQRFNFAMGLVDRDTATEAPTPEDMSSSLSLSTTQRSLAIKLMLQRFPGLDPKQAIGSHRSKNRYQSEIIDLRADANLENSPSTTVNQDSETCRRHDYLNWALYLGYRPPFEPAHLIMHGTKDAPKNRRSIPLSIATKIAEKILSGEQTTTPIEFKLRRNREPHREGKSYRVNAAARDKLAQAIKLRSQTPWPESLFDAPYRYALLLRLSSDAFQKAFDNHMMRKSLKHHFIHINSNNP